MKNHTFAVLVPGIFFGFAINHGALSEEGDEWLLEEVVVTSSRRATSLNDTATSVAAIGSEEISRRDLSEMNDYLRAVPGVSMLDLGVNRNAVVMRGLALDPQLSGVGGQAPLVGVYLGEVPIGGYGIWGGNADIRMVDLERVEVVRGPQGTLFGSSALSGVVRNIPVAPKPSEFEGNLKAGLSNTAKHGDSNTKFEGIINIPLIADTLTLRALAYHHDAAGFIDNIAGSLLMTNGEVDQFGSTASDAVAAFGGSDLYQNENNIGSTEHVGGRVAILWTPVDAF